MPACFCKKVFKKAKMPLGVKPVCSGCESNNSTMWSKSENGEILCNECITKQMHGGKETNGNGVVPAKKGSASAESVQERVLRKSARNKPSKYRVANAKPVATKGKGRRVIFKRSVSIVILHDPIIGVTLLPVISE